MALTLDFNPKLHSVKSFGEHYFRMHHLIKHYTKDITTGVIGKALPSFKDEYGEDKKIDFMITANNQLF
jgi:hypothetical protein